MNALQETILKIANEVKRICEKFSLRYYLDFGSLLGAVRHKGFIPWDDDIDFCMPRPDYEKFIEICGTELSEQFALRSINEDKYIYYFIKIDDKTTTLTEAFNKKSGYRGGVYVDIFPLDGLPNNWIGRKLHAFRRKYYGLIANCALIDFSFKSYPFYKRLITNFFKHFNGRKALKKLDKLLKKYTYEKSKYVSTDIFHNRVIPKELFDDCDNYCFESSIFRSVKSFDIYLKKIYGDYMQLPPIDQRKSNHYFTFDLSEGYLDEK